MSWIYLQYYIQAYYLHVIALVPAIMFVSHFVSKENFMELIHDRWLMLYYTVVLTYCFLNLFTKVMTPYFSTAALALVQIALCFCIFLKRH